MSRSLKKGPFIDERLWRRVKEQKDSGNREPLKTWNRASTVIPDFVGHTFAVSKRKSFGRVLGTGDMVGHKLGQFAPTRMFRGHTQKK